MRRGERRGAAKILIIPVVFADDKWRQNKRSWRPSSSEINDSGRGRRARAGSSHTPLRISQVSQRGKTERGKEVKEGWQGWTGWLVCTMLKRKISLTRFTFFRPRGTLCCGCNNNNYNDE